MHDIYEIILRATNQQTQMKFENNFKHQFEENRVGNYMGSTNFVTIRRIENGWYKPNPILDNIVAYIQLQ